MPCQSSALAGSRLVALVPLLPSAHIVEALLAILLLPVVARLAFGVVKVHPCHCHRLLKLHCPWLRCKRDVLALAFRCQLSAGVEHLLHYVALRGCYYD